MAERAVHQVRRAGDALVLPGHASAHSHAFQRAIRGRSHTRRDGASFWSWRAQMYRVASELDPDDAYALARFAYAELAACGVTAVGEFHYVHHDPSGTPYADRTILADATIRAARDAGLRITLLRVLYARAGAGRPAEDAQRRFVDPDVEVALGDVDALVGRWRDDPCVRVGLAPHSVRAVPAPWLEAARDFAAARALPLHAHVAEQPREIHECLAEHGRRPVELLDELGLLGERFVAVHATHLRAHEARALGGSFVCVCRSTERDLGDGAPDVSALRDAGARLCVGVDGYASSDPFEELRALELDERTRTGARQVVADGAELLQMGLAGYEAIGLTADGDEITLDPADLALVGAPDAEGPLLDDVVAFGASARAVRQVRVAGELVVDGGVPRGLDAARTAYESALRRWA